MNRFLQSRGLDIDVFIVVPAHPSVALLPPSICTIAEIPTAVSQEAEETLASLYAERDELRQAVDLERALKDAAVVANERHILSHKQDQAATAEMAATFKREMEASRRQIEDLQSALMRQSQMTSEAAGQVDKAVVQVNMCI